MTYADAAQQHEVGGPDFTDVTTGIADVLERCREFVASVGGEGRPTRRRRYRTWLLTIAEKVTAAARSGGVFGLRSAVTEVERQFIDDLSYPQELTTA